MGSLHRRAAREAAIEATLGRIDGVRQVRASSLTGNVLVVFDPAVWSTQELVDEIASELGHSVRTAETFPSEPPAAVAPATTRRRSVQVVWAKTPGRARLAVPGLRGRHAVITGVERVLAALDGVNEASASALTGNVLIRFEPSQWTAERLAVTCGETLLDLDHLAHLPPERVNGTTAGTAGPT
ncbi:MAG: hypothetical protein AB7K36_08050, partial [Chloroflexota bacterium]